MAAIEEKLRRNTELVIKMAKQQQCLPRDASQQLARERVDKAMGFRRFNLFSMGPNWK